MNRKEEMPQLVAVSLAHSRSCYEFDGRGEGSRWVLNGGQHRFDSATFVVKSDLGYRGREVVEVSLRRLESVRHSRHSKIRSYSFAEGGAPSCCRSCCFWKQVIPCTGRGACVLHGQDLRSPSVALLAHGRVWDRCRHFRDVCLRDVGFLVPSRPVARH